MGWFWGSNKEDPVKKLDPGLREYLEHEAPKKYVPAQSPAEASPSVPTSADQNTSSEERPLPSASLFPDGRYAHLWKTYKPPVVDEASTQSTGMAAMQQHAKDRSAMTKRAAMENCSIENEVYHLCLKNPTIGERLTACQDKNMVFTRCYATQSKFLNALGYASSPVWDDEREERIQMHADKLFHEMLDYEKRVEQAQEAGLEPPPLTSLFNPQAEPVEPGSAGSSKLEIPGGLSIPEDFKPSKSLERLTPHERELELRAHYQQLEDQKAYVQNMSATMRTQDAGKEKRREKLVSWFGETVGNWMTR
ncbi:hypothetical protein BDV18DRAFT_27419 [Aspergillus unguis]